MLAERPNPDTVAAALDLAVRAPSVHNSQPWQWRFDGGTLELFADRSRQLPATDPQGRGLVLSCGAALHHLRVAAAVLGWTAEVRYLPQAREPDLLAAVEFTPSTPARSDFDLAAAILHRRSDRRRYSTWPVPTGYLRRITGATVRFGAAARHVPEGLRKRLARPAWAALERHARDADYQRELAAWSGRRGGCDGVPAANTPRPQCGDEIPVRTFLDPALADRTLHPDAAEWLVVCTPGDDTRARLRAGEALSALLLTATDLGLSSCLQTEPLGVPALREEIRSQVLHDCAHAQAMVRIGWVPTSAAPLPHTPRRPLDHILV
ncbi:Acg family FMN-binding oxidoreductase [Nocardia otitidiscaviarum]|uniref:Acg family FMN-binding oxidoreductase n=1 Tax=Nocardia otitidiscaviarum TaxID=1823 RepID=UPI0018947413|nr:NAD(P)H nitroreductase [Nocardia otitidiscaviarum]MBF6177179.1 NAD(P)H nitroreductase [Nocardia otitidiscaviarum]